MRVRARCFMIVSQLRSADHDRFDWWQDSTSRSFSTLRRDIVTGVCAGPGVGIRVAFGVDRREWPVAGSGARALPDRATSASRCRDTRARQVERLSRR